jgi:hypothetical protein
MTPNRFARALISAVFAFGSACTQASEADVIAATAKCNADGTCRIDATIKSRDTGWNYYAERFEVVTAGGRILATRVFLHSHEDEQPFTHGLDNVKFLRA